MTTDIRQSSTYAKFMARIGWIVEEIDGGFVYIKKFPLIGAVIKLQRPNKIPAIKKLIELKKKFRARSIAVEPNIYSSHDTFLQATTYQLQALKDPFLPTKTIHIDITPSEQTIFNRFSEAKRRAVRRAEKAGITIKQSNDIDDFIILKNKTAGLFGFLTTSTIKPLWETFGPHNACILVAYEISKSAPIASILILFHDQTAYYWMATATEEGKKSFAPTLLVWEALKLSKQKGMKRFDFEGIYDERYPNLNKNWSGFTKFKEGFGGEMIYYTLPFLQK